MNADGYRLFVATSKPEVTAVEVMEHFDLAKYFTRICGADLDWARNNKDQVIAYLLEQTPEQRPRLMVGDTAYDVTGAAAHGISTIGVAWGYGDVSEMRQAGAIAIAENPDHLLQLIRQQLSRETPERQ